MTEGRIPAGETLTPLLHVFSCPQEPERQYMHIGTMVEFAFALVAKLEAINKHSFNDFKLRVGKLCRDLGFRCVKAWSKDGFTGNVAHPCDAEVEQ